MKYLYINVADLTKVSPLLFSVIFDITGAPIVLLDKKRIDGTYVQISETVAGVQLDDELGNFWVSELKKKGVRSVYRNPPRS